MTTRRSRLARRSRLGIGGGLFALGLMLLALAYACSSSPPEPPEAVIESNVAGLRKAIGKSVKDPERVALLQAEADRLEGLLGELNARVQSFSQDLQTLNADHGATVEQFMEVHSTFEADRRRIRDAVIDLHFTMVGQTTKSEWKKISGYERESLKIAERSDVAENE